MSTASPFSVSLRIDGMTCAHCVARVRKALASVPGVEVQSVAIGSAQVLVADEAVGQAVMAALLDCGHRGSVLVPTGGITPERAGSAGCCGGSRVAGDAQPGSGSCCG